ncbi:hypothetical protein A0H76_48 [Hepatospora eriocheir]|uniref:Uncharacterized protein n=1 Tax=Hepatospora eriocheir TaxID=1081669 RepID=A0A1X0QEZ1_9MICR|nr:hypothetical protein A0H76_48 [Hepatospora eriocheir]
MMLKISNLIFLILTTVNIITANPIGNNSTLQTLTNNSTNRGVFYSNDGLELGNEFYICISVTIFLIIIAIIYIGIHWRK